MGNIHHNCSSVEMLLLDSIGNPRNIPIGLYLILLLSELQ